MTKIYNIIQKEKGYGNRLYDNATVSAFRVCDDILFMKISKQKSKNNQLQ